MIATHRKSAKYRSLEVEKKKRKKIKHITTGMCNNFEIDHSKRTMDLPTSDKQPNAKAKSKKDGS